MGKAVRCRNSHTGLAVEVPADKLRWYYLCGDPEGKITADGFTDFEKKHMRTPEWVPLETALSAAQHHPLDPPALIRRASRMLV